jgi:phosphatidate cytidylyltransferase
VNELASRIKTALVGVSIILGLLLWGGIYGSLLVVLVVSLAMMWEFTEMTLQLSDRPLKKWTLLLSVWIVVGLRAVWPAAKPLEVLLPGMYLLSIAFLVQAGRHELPEHRLQHVREWLASCFGFFWVGVLPLYLVELRSLPEGLHWCLTFLLMIWANDIGAYFAGRALGKHPLAPQISPKKTWEGAFGGGLLSVLISVAYRNFALPDQSLVSALVIPVVLSISGPIGDLIESALKRAYDKKDSGSLLPGHGGFLDRFDSVIWSLPLMYGLVRIIG